MYKYIAPTVSKGPFSLRKRVDCKVSFVDGWEIAGILQLLSLHKAKPIIKLLHTFRILSSLKCQPVENRDNLCTVPVFLRNWQDTHGVHPPHDPKININNCKKIQTTSTNDSTRGMTKGSHES